jgi:pimeloyl-ACP methyl ester carboxylesterase
VLALSYRRTDERKRARQNTTTTMEPFTPSSITGSIVPVTGIVGYPTQPNPNQPNPTLPYPTLPYPTMPRDDDDDKTQSLVPQLVLIHGAWQGAWAWEALVPLLEQACDCRCHALDLPGHGADTTGAADVTLDLYLDYLTRYILHDMDPEAPVYLVGHSGGGQVATALADRLSHRIAGIVYIAGMAFPHGQSFAHVQAQLGELAQGVSPHVVLNLEGTATMVPPAAAVTYFYNDCTDAVAHAAASKLTPQPVGGRSTVPLHVGDAFWDLPKLYLETTRDASVVVEAQRIMQGYLRGDDKHAADSKLTVVSLATGHAPLLSAPHLVSQAMVAFVSTVEEGKRVLR